MRLGTAFLMGVMLAGSALSPAAHAGVPAGTVLPLHIGGRVVPVGDDPALGYTHQWPGTYFEARFKGTEVHMRLNDSVNKLAIYVDGRQIDTANRPGEGDIQLGPLKPGDHTIRVEKLTESASTAAQFTGFFVSDPADVLPAPEASQRQIEFIGDSYTVGYGNMSTSRTCPGEQVWATTNTQLAFGPLTAKHFKAEYRINAISGRGVVRNYNGASGLHLPQAYLNAINLTGPSASVSASATKDDWKPQIIVIGLGTNDFTTPLHGGEIWTTREELHADYEKTYVEFVQDLRAANPGAYFILMATDQANGEIQSEVKKVVALLKAAGESRIDFIPMNGLGFGGCDWHPDVADDRSVADSLIGYIEGHADLWPHP
ncbi:SGNH/GDSL hydrolase family protein [Asticcacaulis sp. AC466]|uniref:SGNH/GDSL hydrolase family protein n=1 Tax=Asticcacaulis sp. AC466 TaxID=1282362 RepID=UPI0004297BA8|nr:SGNH/GDSL hydrolase family protein [Asticcacaulis sp. AC466]